MGVVAPSVVPVVGNDTVAAAVEDAHDIALRVQSVVVGGAVPCNGGGANGAVGKVQRVGGRFAALVGGGCGGYLAGKCCLVRRHLPRKYTALAWNKPEIRNALQDIHFRESITTYG